MRCRRRRTVVTPLQWTTLIVAMSVTSSLSATDHSAASAAFQKGVALFNECRYEEAIRALDRAISLDPGRSSTYVYRSAAHAVVGNAIAARADHEAALRVAQEERARATTPTTPAFSDKMPTDPLAKGIALFDECRYDEALMVLNQAVEHSSDKVKALSYRSATHAVLGHLEQAKADHERATSPPPVTITVNKPADPPAPKRLALSATETPQPSIQPSDKPSVKSSEPAPAAKIPTADQGEGSLRFAQEIPAPQVGPPPAPSADTSPVQVPETPFRAGEGILRLGSQSATQATQGTTVAPSAVGNSINAAAAQADAPQTTGQLLERAPSVNLLRTSAVNLDPRVRGYRMSQLNASANGITQLKTRVDIDSLFSSIDPGIVNNLQVIDGPYTSKFGPGYAFLIADLMPTPRYDQARGEGRTILSQDTNGRNFYFRQNLLGGGQNWGVVASYGLRFGSAYNPGGNSTDFQVPAAYNQWDGFTSAGFDVSKRSRVEFNYVRVEKNGVQLPGVVYDITQSVDEQWNIRYVVQEDKQSPERFLVQYWWTKTPYQGNSLNPLKQQTFYQAFIVNDFRGFVPPNNAFNLSATFSRGFLQTQGVRSLLTFGEKDSPLLTLGADWRRYTQLYVENHIDTSTTNPTIIFGDNVFGIPQSSQEDAGLLANLDVPVNDYINTSLGGRLDFTQSFFNNTPAINPTPNNPAQFNPVTPGTPTFGTGKPSYLLGMAYSTTKIKLLEYTYLNAGTAFAMRNPNLAELYSNSPFVPLVRVGNATTTGNSLLQPEKNIQVDLGISHEVEDWFSFGLRGYNAVVFDYILYTLQGFNGSVNNSNNPFASKAYGYTNLDQATLAGGDMSLWTKLLPYMGTFASMSYVKGTNWSPTETLFNPDGTPQLNPNGTLVQRPKGSGEGLPGIYPFTSTLGLRFFQPVARGQMPRWSFDVITRMVNGQQFVADSLFEYATQGFTVFDLRAHYNIRDNIRLTSSILNLFDRTYYEHGSLAVVDRNGNFSFVKEPGFNFRVGLEVSY